MKTLIFMLISIKIFKQIEKTRNQTKSIQINNQALKTYEQSYQKRKSKFNTPKNMINPTHSWIPTNKQKRISLHLYNLRS